jgi:predicted DNA-binding protein
MKSLGSAWKRRVAPTILAMYIHRMIRTQLYLPNATHARLRVLARQQGRTLSDLVREAIERAFGQGSSEEQERTLRAIAGLWRGRKDIAGTREYVRELRRSTRPRIRKR